jgi:hypothetical protein
MTLDDFIETARKFESIPPYWDIASRRDIAGQWIISASIWMDNGHGGSKTSFEIKNNSLIKAMKEILEHIDKHTKMFSHRYH